LWLSKKLGYPFVSVRRNQQLLVVEFTFLLLRESLYIDSIFLLAFPTCGFRKKNPFKKLSLDLIYSLLVQKKFQHKILFDFWFHSSLSKENFYLFWFQKLFKTKTSKNHMVVLVTFFFFFFFSWVWSTVQSFLFLFFPAGRSFYFLNNFEFSLSQTNSKNWRSFKFLKRGFDYFSIGYNPFLSLKFSCFPIFVLSFLLQNISRCLTSYFVD